MKQKDIQPMETNSIAVKSEGLLDHWQSHRRLTRRMIDAFPEDKLFSYSVGGMRPFAELALEMIDMAAPGIQGLVSGEWEIKNPALKELTSDKPKTKRELLDLWDVITTEINRLWPQIPSGRFQEVDTAFGQWTDQVYKILFYWIDNEIHHRGQGYVYLRSLGIDPPAFWDRA